MKLREDKKTQIVALLARGLPLKEISLQSGVSKPTIIKIKKESLLRSESSRSETSQSESSRSESSRYTEISNEDSLTLNSEDSGSDTGSESGSESGSKKVFVQRRAFLENHGGELEQETNAFTDNALEQFRLSLLTGKADTGKGKADTVKGKADTGKVALGEIKADTGKVESKADTGKVESKADTSKVNANITMGERKEALVCKIALYIETFPQKLGQLTQGKHDINSYLRSLTVEELEKLLGQVRYRCSNAGITDSCTLAFQTMASLVEQVGCKAGLKLQGYAAGLAQNQQARECLSELTIEYLSEVAITPQRRLIMICLMQGYSIHSSNSLEEKTRSLLDEKIDPAQV